MPNSILRLLARMAAGLLVLHLFFFWVAERQGTFLGFEPAHFKDSALLFFLVAVYLLLESHFLIKEREVVEEEIVSITEEESIPRTVSMRAAVTSGAAWKNPYITSAIIVGAALIVAGAVISGPKGTLKITGDAARVPTAPPAPAQAPTAPSAPGQKVAVTFGDTPILNKNAKVQFIEFSDYQCPFCGRFFTDAYGQIKKKYIDTGKIAFQIRDYPLPFHQNAQKSAEAARCSLEQSEKQFWAMHDWLFQNQNTLEVANLKNAAKILGLNTSKFDPCLDSGKYAAAVKKDSDAGAGYGVSGTPSFFLNGEMIVGAQPYATFEQKIEAALAAK